MRAVNPFAEIFRRLTAVFLACGLILLCPGPGAYQAFARSVAPVPSNAAASALQAPATLSPNTGTSALVSEAAALSIPISVSASLPQAAFQAPASDQVGAQDGPIPFNDSLSASFEPNPARQQTEAGLGMRTPEASKPGIPSAALFRARAGLMLGRLASTAAALPRLLSLQGARLKTESGAFFEQPPQAAERGLAMEQGRGPRGFSASLRSNSLRAPAAGFFDSVPARALPTTGRAKGVLARAAPVALAALAVTAAFLLSTVGVSWGMIASLAPWPLLFLGTVRSGDGGEEKPTSQQIEAFRKKVQEKLKPGQMLGVIKYHQAIGAGLGLSQPNTLHALQDLTDHGYFVAFNNGRFMYIDLNQEKEGEYAQAAVKEARIGVQFLDSDQAVDHVLAYAHLENAFQWYEPGKPSKTREQVESLRNNAALEVLVDIVEDYHGRLKSSGQAKAHRRKVGQFLHIISSLYFDVNSAPKRFNAAAGQWIETLINQYSRALQAQYQDLPQQEKIADAFKALSRFTVWMTEREEPRNIPAASYQGGSLIISHQGVQEQDKGFRPLRRDQYKALYTYGENITEQAAAGKYDPLIGRRDVLRKMVKTLLRRKKNNPVLIGEAGVGKTELVHGLAQMIVDGEIPKLAGRNIFSLDMGRLVAGTKYRGQFEERLKQVVDDILKAKGQAIFFMDELHALIGLGSAEGTADATNLLKAKLASGELLAIGATTLAEFRRIERDKALRRRFQPIMVPQPSLAEAEEIVERSKSAYESHHGVIITPEAVRAAVRMAEKYTKDVALPDSAFDLIDDASAEVALKAQVARAASGEVRLEVLPQDIAFEIWARTGIPIAQMGGVDMERLKGMPKRLRKRVIGQEEAVRAVSRAVARRKLGYGDDSQPQAFVFAGPTGAGKTELAKALAEDEFGSEDNMVRIDMSEFMERHSVSGLIGPPPGYVGFENISGRLTEPVRRNPYTVVLLDEMEKAHPDARNILLQVLQDGRLTDSEGRTVDFSNAIIIMTINTGSEVDDKRGIGLPTPNGKTERLKEKKEKRRREYVESFKRTVSPEFFNRIGERNILVFDSLRREDIENILQVRMTLLNKRLSEQERLKGMSVKLSDEAKREIVDEAHSERNRPYGARPLKKMIDDTLADELTQAELDGRIQPGDKVVVDYDRRAKSFTVRKDEPEDTLTSKLMGVFPIIFGTLPPIIGIPLLVLGALFLAWRAYQRGYLFPLPHAQAPPASRAQGGRRDWLVPALLWAGLLLGLDWGFKYLFASSGLSFVYHELVPVRMVALAVAIPLNLVLSGYYLQQANSKEPLRKKLVGFRERHPILGLAGYAALWILTFPIGLSRMRFAGDLVRKYPEIRKALAIFNIVAAASIAGTLGNGLEGLWRQKVVDFIPIGHAHMNLADAYLFLGWPFIWKALDFFSAVRKSEGNRRPITLNGWKQYVFIMLGLMFFTFSTAAGFTAIPAAAWYAIFFAAMFSVGTVASDIYFSRLVQSFNRRFRSVGTEQVYQERPRLAFSRGYRWRKTVKALLASALAAFSPGRAKAVTVPKLSAANQQALIGHYTRHPPKLVLLDWDNTFMDNTAKLDQPVGEDRLELLRRLKKKGIRVAFVTNRPLRGGDFGMLHLLFERMDPESRRDFILSVGGSSEIYRFGPNGEVPEKPAILTTAAIRPQDRELMQRIMHEEMGKLGIVAPVSEPGDSQSADCREQNGRAYEYSIVLENKRDKAEALFAEFDKRAREAGLDYDVRLKKPEREENAPYIRVRSRNAVKAAGVRGILQLLEAQGQLTDERDILIGGDESGLGEDDASMGEGAPGATALAVGERADARQKNLHLIDRGATQSWDVMFNILTQVAEHAPDIQ